MDKFDYIGWAVCTILSVFIAATVFPDFEPTGVLGDPGVGVAVMIGVGGLIWFPLRAIFKHLLWPKMQAYCRVWLGDD